MGLGIAKRAWYFGWERSVCRRGVIVWVWIGRGRPRAARYLNGEKPTLFIVVDYIAPTLSASMH